MDNPSVDIALFGRMVADDPSLNFNASAQVAHAISTHAVQTEYDFFTAVDDLSPEENSGAGHLGTTEFNSSTMYRYASLNVRELYSYLGADTVEAAVNFVKAMILFMPAGKQNTFANRTVPDLVYVTIRTDQPVNLCGAYERAITPGKDGYVSRSVDKLFEYANSVYENFVGKPATEYVVGKNNFTKDTISVPEMLEAIEVELDHYIGSAGK